MGRDTSVVLSHPAAVSEPLRAIISAEYAIDPKAEALRFSLKPRKVFLFEAGTDARIPFAAE
jgi:multiple sugar transport system ATP-binding protein